FRRSDRPRSRRLHDQAIQVAMEPVDPEVRLLAGYDPEVRKRLEEAARGGHDLGPGQLVADAEVLAEAEPEVVRDAVDPTAGAALLAQPEVGPPEVEPARLGEDG